jgi:hypothetical protein
MRKLISPWGNTRVLQFFSHQIHIQTVPTHMFQQALFIKPLRVYTAVFQNQLVDQKTLTLWTVHREVFIEKIYRLRSVDKISRKISQNIYQTDLNRSEVNQCLLLKINAWKTIWAELGQLASWSKYLRLRMNPLGGSINDFCLFGLRRWLAVLLFSALFHASGIGYLPGTETEKMS